MHRVSKNVSLVYVSIEMRVKLREEKKNVIFNDFIIIMTDV